jgi:hypothetical protein
MNNTPRPLFSIICAVYNGAGTLTRFIQSVINQEFKNFELIIVDGGSKDDTIKIIKQYESYISYWISESDEGIYHAWNKGIGKATGEWIMFLGCDDVLTSDALNRYKIFIDQYNNSEELDIISSRVQMVSLTGKPTKVKGSYFKWPLFLRNMTIAHPGALHSVKFFKKYGCYNIKYKIVGDYELLLRARENLRSAFFNEVTVIMSEGGTSDSVAAIREHLKAVISTGKQQRFQAYINFIFVFMRYKISKMVRIIR